MKNRQLSAPIKTDTENYFYVLESPDKRGWLIIAGNDDVTPIIAYSDEGSFCQSSSRNENFEYRKRKAGRD